jgi:hypothetical protein
MFHERRSGVDPAESRATTRAKRIPGAHKRQAVERGAVPRLRAAIIASPRAAPLESILILWLVLPLSTRRRENQQARTD